MILILFKKVPFFVILCRKKPKSIKAIDIYASESSHYTLSENDMLFRGVNHRPCYINNWNTEKDTDSAEL